MSDLSKFATNKAIGPDGISNRPVKEIAFEFTPIIKDIYNQSLRAGFLPVSLKRSIITPVPKISPPQDIELDPRPIALTSCLAKVLEGFNHRRLLKQVNCNIDPRQYAWEGNSTTQALIYLLHAIHEAADTGNCCASIFFADFSNRLDMIDHNILLQELCFLNVD